VLWKNQNAKETKILGSLFLTTKTLNNLIKNVVIQKVEQTEQSLRF